GEEGVYAKDASQVLVLVVIHDGAQLPPPNDLLGPARRVSKKQTSRSERQFERAVTGELMSVVESKVRLFDGSIGRIAIGRSGVGIAIAESLAPGPRCRVREAMAEPSGELQLQGVIRRTTHIIQHRNARI